MMGTGSHFANDSAVQHT